METKKEKKYPNLMAELARAGLTVLELSAKTGIPYSTLIGKLGGRSEFTLDEAFAIKSVLQVNQSIDELFERVA